MAAKKFYYNSTIKDIIGNSTSAIFAEIVCAHNKDINDSTKQSWLDEISILKAALSPYTCRGSIFFEYNIPRMGRRRQALPHRIRAFVPNGDYGVPPDKTRLPAWYDGIYNYLKSIGITSIDQ